MSVSSDKNVSPTTISVPPSSGSPITSISRQLRLRSDQAFASQSPTSKTWKILGLNANPEVQYKVAVQTFRIKNVFPNIPQPVFLIVFDPPSGITTAVIIPPGQYDGDELAQMITYKFSEQTATKGYSVAFDSKNHLMQFTPAIVFAPGDPQQGYTNGLLTQIGLPANEPSIFGKYISRSLIPCDLTGVSFININTDWSFFNVPISGWLGSYEMEAKFGELNKFKDGDEFLCMNNNLDSITVSLTDQNGVDLSMGYIYIDSVDPQLQEIGFQTYIPTWEIVLSIEETGFEGFQKLLNNEGVPVHQVK